MDPEINDLLKLIDHAFAQRNYVRVIKAIDDSSNRIQPSKQFALMRAKANIELCKINEGILDINKAIQLGASVEQYGLLQIRAFLQANQPNKAQKTLKQFIKDNKAMQKIHSYTKAISILQDGFEVHCLEKKQQDLFTKMKTRLYSAGAQFDKLQVVNLAKGYRGVIAAKTINKKTPIVYIPKSEIMTLEMAKLNRYCERLIAKNYKLLSPKHTYLSILLLQEKANPHSRWRLYIDSLPEDHSCFPINFNIEELQMLQGSPFLYMIHEKVMDLKKDYTTILKSDSSFQKYSFMEFCWARMMVGSRIFGVNILGVKTQILVPFADMLNHRLPKQTAWNYSDDFNGFVIESLQKIEVGQEVFDSYGKKCNTRFLLNYGFVIPNNQQNQIALKIGMNQNTPLYKQKMTMLKLHYDSDFVQVMKTPINTNSSKFFQLMGYLRFVNVDTRQNLDVLAKISKISQTKDPYRPSRTPPISIPNEISVWRHFLQICRQALAQYKTTLEQDKQICKQKNLSQNIKNILTLRMGQKQILKQFIEMGQELIIVLTSQKIIQQLQHCVSRPYFRYIYKILNLTPGVNKKQLQKRLGAIAGSQLEQDLSEKEEDTESCIRNQC